MMRGTFANVRIENEMLDGVEGGYTIHHPRRPDDGLRSQPSVSRERHAAGRVCG